MRELTLQLQKIFKWRNIQIDRRYFLANSFEDFLENYNFLMSNTPFEIKIYGGRKLFQIPPICKRRFLSAEESRNYQLFSLKKRNSSPKDLFSINQELFQEYFRHFTKDYCGFFTPDSFSFIQLKKETIPQITALYF